MSSDLLTDWNNGIQILVGVATLAGSIYAVYKIIKRFVFNPLTKHFSYVKTHLERINILSNKLENAVFPIIESLNREFSKNSGKSIKDQISRIDDLVRLADLRSKLLASSFSNIGIYECDASGKCTWVNKALCDLWGMEASDIIGNGWLKGVSEDEREETMEKWFSSIKNDIPYDSVYDVINQKTFEKIRVKTTAIANKSLDGKILGYYGQVIRL